MKSKIISTVMMGVLLVGGVSSGGVPAAAQTAPAPGAGSRMPPPVRVASASTATISRSIERTGELVALRFAVIAAMAEGPVVFCPWREGDRVTAGQRLVEIERRVYRAEVQAAQAAVAVARARLADMRAGTRPEEIAKAQETVRQLAAGAAFRKVDLERTAELVAGEALPGEMLEKARVDHVAEQTRLAAAEAHLEMLRAGPTETTLAVQAAAVAEAEARLALARARLAECVIEAPFAGTITRVHVQPGALATAKAPLIELADLSSVVARFAVAEPDAAAVRPGTLLDATLDAYPGKKLRGEVVRVYPELDRRTRTRTVEARITAAPELLPGMFGRLTVYLETAPDAVVVPAEAVVTAADGSRAVFLVEAGQAVRRRVETGIEAAGRIQIVRGIRPGDKVVVAGNEKLKDGAAVRIADGPAPGAGKPGGPQDRPAGAAAEGGGSRP